MCVCSYMHVHTYVHTVERRLSKRQLIEKSIIRTSHEVADSAMFFPNIYIILY